MQHGAERYITEIRRSPMIARDTVGEHGYGMWIVTEKHARPLHTDTAATVRMIHKHEFAPIRECFFQRRELPRLGPEGLLLGDPCNGEQRQAKTQA
jgi:hypothetical protein